MKDNEKKAIAVLVAITIIVIIVAIVRGSGNKEEVEQEKKAEVSEEEFVQLLNDGTRLNISEELKKTKTIDGMEITNIQLTEKGKEYNRYNKRWIYSKCYNIR